MKRANFSVGVAILILISFVLLAAFGSSAVTVISQRQPLENRKCIMIDAGHGGEDGGTQSSSGELESNINLQIALRLNDLFHLLGVKTQMIRTSDCSVNTGGQTIGARKVSDLKERVRLVSESNCTLLLSIHQNYFSDSRYSGAQVFYSSNIASKELAQALQTEFIRTLNPGSHRNIKKSDGIYLMDHITCPAVLIECGFLSNPREDMLLRDNAYQKKLCAVIAGVSSNYLHNTMHLA